MKKQLSMPIVIMLLVIVSGLGFFGGMQYTKMQRGGGRFGQAASEQGGFKGRNGTSGNRPVMGQIISMDDKSLTVKMPDGSSKIVILSSSTAINKQATGSKSDLKTGETVMVIGSSNSDGSVTAQNIQLNPQMRGTMRGQQATPNSK